MYYKIIKTNSPSRHDVISELEHKVNNSIQAGFEPIGGVCVESDAQGAFFYQAVIDRQKEDIEQ